jgi:hypothetical protein
MHISVKTGPMRRTHLRGHTDILKRLLVQHLIVMLLSLAEDSALDLLK